MRPISSTVVWRSAREIDDVWAALTDTGSYRRWWPWLERFEGEPTALGVVQAATVRAPAGYRVHYAIRFTEVDRPRRLATVVDGDLGGSAQIDLASEGSGTRLTFSWTLHARRRLLRVLGVIASPLLVHGHDLIVSRGVDQFVAGSGIDLVAVDGG